MKIKVDVNNVTITEKSDIHKGEYNVNKCIFEFSSEYTKDLIYRAVFSCINGSYYQLILNNECNIPDEVLKEKDVNIELGVYAFILNDDNELELRYSPKPTYFKVENGSYKDGDKTEVPSPTDYEKFLNEFNRNANEKTEVFDENYGNKVNSFNNNATQKINEYNKNADERVKEINNKVSDIEKIEDNIEQIQKNVQASEQNAKTSETNAKTSEINAQNSAKNASEIETNIISIQEDINKSKGEINTAKESVDKSLEKVYSAVTEATNQAKESKKQAGIATSKANQTSIDKSAVETMRNEVSSMKTSVEQTKTDTEKIKADTQAIKDDTEALKEETLQAKEEVENSLENERIISDKKYARAIDSDVISVDNFGQVDVEQDGYMKDVEIESALPEITQEKREGYNRLDISTLQELDQDGVKLTKENGVVTLNGRSTATFFIDAYIVGSSSAYEEFLPAGTYTVSGITGEVLSPNFGILIVIKHLDESKTTIIQNGENKVFNVADSDIFRVFIRIPQNLQLNNIVIKPMIVLGTENKDFEQYGSSPSLNYPSEFKNILSSFNIKNTVDEIEKYNKQITLPENKFLGNFNGYKNIIQNGKLKCNLKIYKLDANMDFSVNGTGTTGVQFLTPIIEDLKSNLSAKNILSTISKNLVGSTASKKIRFIIPYKELGTTSENTKAEHIAALKNKLSNIRGEFLYPVDNEEETELEDINLPLYKGINNIFAEDLKVSFKYNVSIEKYIEDNNIIERKISDNKYPRALKIQVTDVEQAQIYADNSEVEELKIKGVELTQKVREGYNKLNVSDFKNGAYNYGTSNQVPAWASNNIRLTLEPSKAIEVLPNTEYTVIFPKEYSYSVAQLTSEKLTNGDSGWITYTEDNKKTIFTTKDNTKYVAFNVKNSNNDDSIIDLELFKESKVLLYEGTESKEYEQYGASPSLDYPSEIQVAGEQNISIFRKNIIDTNNINALGKIVVSSKIDGGLNVSGVAAANYKTLSTINLDIPIKAGTSLFSAFGKTLDLLKDNTDITPYFWLYNKNGTNFYTIRGSSKVILTQDVYKITWGIENFILEKEYSEDIYIELEISDKQPTQFQKYENIDINVAIENGAIGKSFDIINKETNFQNKVIKEVIFSGDENWGMNYGVSMFGLEFNEIDFNTDNKIAFCNYFKFNEVNSGIYNTLKDNEFTLQLSQGFKKIFFKSLKYTTKAEWKAKLKELYEAGTPVKVYYVAETADKISLSEEVKQELDKFKLYDGLNNIFIDNGSLSFKYNKSLLRAFEEQSELSASLLERVQALEAAQLSQVGGN